MALRADKTHDSNGLRHSKNNASTRCVMSDTSKLVAPACVVQQLRNGSHNFLLAICPGQFFDSLGKLISSCLECSLPRSTSPVPDRGHSPAPGSSAMSRLNGIADIFTVTFAHLTRKRSIYCSNKATVTAIRTNLTTGAYIKFCRAIKRGVTGRKLG